MTVYISGSITNEPNYKALFEQGANEVRSMGNEPVNPVDLPHDHDKTWESYMKEDLTALLKCDGAYFLSNWKESRGAKIEFDLAVTVGLKIIMQ